jgi:hypothetical protein
MKCTCPKCHTNIELSLPAGALEHGTAVSCSACSAKFNVMMESFAGRVFRRSGEISCSSCGSILGPEIHCTNCGIIYPDYWVAGGRRKEPGGRGFNLQLKSSPFKKQQKPAAGVDIMSLQDAMKDQSPAAKTKPATAAKSYDRLVVPGILVALVLLLAVGAGIYSRKKAETTYMKTFVRAAYGIQVGEDSSRKICQRIATEWKAKIDAGQNYAARPTADEEKELTVIRARLDTMKAKLPPEPEQFKNSADNLAKLEASYNKLRGLALTPGNSLPAFTDSLNKLDNDYNKSARELKAALPKKLMDELTAGAQKFRGLKPLLQAG